MADVSIQIPDDARQYLSLLASLTATEREGFLSALGQLDVAPADAFAEAAERHVPFDAGQDSREFARSVLGLAFLGVTHSYDVDDLATTVAESEDLDLDEDAREDLRASLVTLLNFDSLTSFAKALDLIQQSDRLASDSRIVTDLRPVFDADAGRPTGFLITHSLRIAYFEEGKVRTFTVSLDLDDLEKLQSTLTRAITKHHALQTWAASSGLVDLSGAITGGEDR